MELSGELSLLEGGGAGANIQRGPDWAKANLTPEQIGYVRRLIEVREDLLFRCRNFVLDQEATEPSSAPAMAPLPVRRPAVPEAGMHGVPVPIRPAQAQVKAQEQEQKQPEGRAKAGAAKDGMSAVGAPKPQLRGTLSATPKDASAAKSAPARKTKPIPAPAIGN